MPVDLYYLPPSPPCRSVMLLAKAIGVHLNLKTINVMEGEQLKSEFLKLNPQHTIPTLDDNGFVLWESRPIMGYLVDKYARNDFLYPKDPRNRGIVDQILYFDIGTLYQNLGKCYFPVIFGKSKVVQEEDLQALEKSFEVLNTFLEGKSFVAGGHLTIADFSVVTTVNTSEAFGFDIGRYDNVAAWYDRCKRTMEKFGYEEINTMGAKILGDMYRSRLSN